VLSKDKVDLRMSVWWGIQRGSDVYGASPMTLDRNRKEDRISVQPSATGCENFRPTLLDQYRP
jgi:hypothetical protein